MPAFQKINLFTDDLVKARHNFATDIFKVMLTNVAPTPTDHVQSDIVEITPQNGYVAGGLTLSISLIPLNGVESVNAPSVAWTANGGSFGPFEWAVLYNVSQALLIGWWDSGQTITLGDSQTFTVSPVGGTLFTIS